MYADCVFPKFPFHLSYGFEERGAFYVADGSSYLGDDEVVVVLLAKILNVALYLVGDVWHHLYCLTEIVTPALLIDYRLVDSSCGQRVRLCGLYASEALVVAEVEIRFHTVNRDVALSVLVWVECTRVDVNVGVELLYSDVVTPCLQQFAY